jgi:NAD-dependent deacetylase
MVERTAHHLDGALDTYAKIVAAHPGDLQAIRRYASLEFAAGRYEQAAARLQAAFARNPEKVHAFYNARRQGLLSGEVAPNAAHLALARLEAAWPGAVLLITQNIDDLHERAGSRNLLHMHGELLKARCLCCGDVTPWRQDMSLDSTCPACARPGGLRVHVVWFGEMPFEMDRIFSALEVCDLFVSIGTSGSVYPAAGFVQEVRMIGQAHTVELNLEPSEGHSLFAERHYGPAGKIVPEFVERILSEGW